MLDKQDLKAIGDLMDEKIGASEARIKTELGDLMDEKIGASEARIKTELGDLMDEKIGASENRMMTEIGASENRIFAYLESGIEPQIKLIAEGVTMLNERISTLPTAEDLEITNSRIDTLEAIVKRLSRDVEQLKRAQ